MIYFITMHSALQTEVSQLLNCRSLANTETQMQEVAQDVHHLGTLGLYDHRSYRGSFSKGEGTPGSIHRARRG